MQAVVGSRLISRLQPDEKPYEVRDTRLPGFVLRIQPSGAMSYYVELGRGRRMSIGKTSVLTPAQARDRAKELLADYVRGQDPLEARRRGKSHTLRSFIAEKYSPWVAAAYKSGAEQVRKIAIFFSDLGEKKLAEISAFAVETHRSKRLKAGIKPATVNREIDALRSALRRAVEWGLLPEHPLRTVKRSREGQGRVRFLTEDERGRLLSALDDRIERMRQARERYNAWRAERGRAALPDRGPLGDFLKPMVILAMNTGLRRGELLGLKWSDLDLEGRILTVVGATAKTLRTRHIPLNDTATDTLRAWRDQTKAEDLVFPGKNGSRLVDIKKTWKAVLEKARIEKFTFHCLRHDFASQLVMRGTDLRTVQELLGHSSPVMTAKYAHLAPAHKAAAVARLDLRQAR